jgi:hypothetical protein
LSLHPSDHGRAHELDCGCRRGTLRVYVCCAADDPGCCETCFAVASDTIGCYHNKVSLTDLVAVELGTPHAPR